MDLRADRSFHLDRGARSFRPSDFGLGDVPWLVVAFAAAIILLTGAAYLFDAVGQLLPPAWRPVILSSVMGFLVGLRVSGWSTRRSRDEAVASHPSDAEPRAAADPGPAAPLP